MAYDVTLPGLAIFGLLLVAAILSLLPKGAQRGIAKALFPVAGNFQKYPVLSVLCGWLFVLILVFAGLAILAHTAASRSAVALLISLSMLATAAILARAYHLLGRARNRLETLWLLVASLPLVAGIYFTVRRPGELTAREGPVFFAAMLVLDTFFIWRCIYFLTKGTTKAVYSEFGTTRASADGV